MEPEETRIIRPFRIPFNAGKCPIVPAYDGSVRCSDAAAAKEDFVSSSEENKSGHISHISVDFGD